ncbi:hypothetical protein DL765_005746 [Monosporascus sp. GIB2]|nr:hypothetical protein DL765_005746 [Monosporascus sp. GIB2]
MSPQMDFALCAAAILVTYVLCFRISLYIRARRFVKSHGCMPAKKAPSWDPIFGLDHFARLGRAAAEHRYLSYWDQRMFGRFGNTFSINLMGKRLVFTNEPRNMQAVLVTQFADFDIGQRRRDISAQLLGVGLFNADGEVWEHARATVWPNLTRKQVADLGMFEKHVQVWVNAMPTDGKSVDLQEWVFRFTLDVGTDFLFDSTTGVLHPNATDRGRQFAWAFDLGVEGVSQRLRLGRLAFLYFNRDYAKACKVVHGFVDSIVHVAVEKARNGQSHEFSVKNEKATSDEGRYTFLKALASEGMSSKEIRDQMLNILIATRDTSACLMSAAFFELSRRPHEQARLRDEIENTLARGRTPTYDDLKNMTYLKWFINETLRLYPPIPFNIRVANKDTVLPVGGGPDESAPIFIPRGTEVAYQVFSTHRRRDLWGDDAISGATTRSLGRRRDLWGDDAISGATTRTSSDLAGGKMSAPISSVCPSTQVPAYVQVSNSLW